MKMLSPSAGVAASASTLRDHQLAVAEAADDVLLVAERLDHGDGRGDARRRRGAGARAARRARPRSTPGRRGRSTSLGERELGAGHSDAQGIGLADDDPAPTVFIGGLPMKRATKRFAGRS